MKSETTLTPFKLQLYPKRRHRTARHTARVCLRLTSSSYYGLAQLDRVELNEEEAEASAIAEH